jgi:hypothetical protein
LADSAWKEIMTSGGRMKPTLYQSVIATFRFILGCAVCTIHEIWQELDTGQS